MAFNMFPFTNLHNLNTDWILKTIKELKTAAEQAAATVASYAARLTGLEDSVVKFTPQSLTAGQKQTARSNIGAISEADVTGTVKYNTEQQLTPEQQETARGNISAAPSVGVVYYNTAQSLSDAYKTQARNNIGAAAASAISDVLRYSSQSLTNPQKAQARNNIGAAAAGDVPTIDGVVRYDESQSLTAGQKQTARSNIGAISEADVTGTVKYNTEQQLTGEQQKTARGNISAAPSVGVVYYNTAQSLSDAYKSLARKNIGAAAASAISDVLRYSSQSLTNPQKAQARNNIGAMPADTDLPLEVKISYDNGYSMDQDMDDILHALDSGLPVVITCVDVGTWPGFSSFTNLRNVSISQLQVIRSGSSDDFNIVGDALLAFDETTRKLQILHLSLSLLSGSTSIYPTIWGMLGAPLATAQDIGKWLKVDSSGYPVWAELPVYQGGVV